MAKKGQFQREGYCCHCQHITVSFILKNVLFSNKDDLTANPSGLWGMMHFIDDLGGRWRENGGGSSIEPFRFWMSWLHSCTKRKCGFEFTGGIGMEVEFLDILISFDNLGNPITDLFIKPTAARKYLSPDFCHPSHTFNGVVYWQGLCLR